MLPAASAKRWLAGAESNRRITMSCSNELLRCPICKTALLRMGSNQLSEFNCAISRGELRHADGTSVAAPMADAYICPREQLAYPANNGIWLLLPALAVIPKGQSPPDLSNLRFGAEKKTVQDFYDQLGWTTVGQQFADTLIFADLRPVSLEYREKTHQRARSYLNKTGRYVLDAASGALPHPEMSVYSEGFDYRICLDFSFRALEAAQQRLGERGIYLLGDMTNLPLLDDSVDSIISLHTIYHIPAEEQRVALRELYRVLKPSGRAVIVYSWGSRSLLMKLGPPTARLNRGTIGMASFLASPPKRRSPEGARAPATPGAPLQLYSHFHSYSWFARELKAIGSFQLACWRSVNTAFLENYVKSWLCGKQLLSVLCWLEGTFRWIFGRIGQYPMFIIPKPELPKHSESAENG